MPYKKFTCTVIVMLVICIGLVMSLQAFAEEKGAAQQVEELKAVLIFTEHVSVDTTSYSVGESKYGYRNVVPITGGYFEGPKIKGEVLPGGADWQLTRPDGDTELNARYTLKTNDGYVIQITNKVFGTRSVVDFEAPVSSPYDWLNHGVFVGSMGDMGGGGQPPKQGDKAGMAGSGQQPKQQEKKSGVIKMQMPNQGEKFYVTIKIYQLL
jgi:hypothetical protein